MRKGNFTEEFAFVGEIMISLRLGNGWGHDHQHNEAHDRHSPRENCAFPHFHASELRETERYIDSQCLFLGRTDKLGSESPDDVDLFPRCLVYLGRGG